MPTNGEDLPQEIAMQEHLYSISEIAKKEGVFRHTVIDLIRKHKIPTVQHPLNGSAKGVSDEGYSKIRSLLTPEAVAG